MKLIKNAFTDISGVGGQMQPPTSNYMERLKTIQVGDGGKTMKVDKKGLWLGGSDKESAPFSVDMDGNAVLRSVTVNGYITNGGAAADVNNGTTEINGDKIVTGSIEAEKLSVDELEAVATQTGKLYAGSTQKIIIDGDNKIIRLRDSSNRDVITIDGANGRFRVAKEGQDADSPGTDGANLVMSSEFNSFKIVGVYTTSIYVAGGGSSAVDNYSTVTHNLGYKPMAIGAVYWNGWTMLPYTYIHHGSTDDVIQYYFNMEAITTTTCKVHVAMSARGAGAWGGGTISFKVYLLRETVA